jgi:hypothetical protein
MPTLRATNQSGLGFAAKKSIHPSPARKKTQSIDLTASSPPLPAKSFAPLFNQRKRTSATNPFEEEEEEEEEEKPKTELVEKDEFGFVKTVPAGFAPLGKGKPTAEMIENLVGSNEKDLDGEDSNDDEVEAEEEEEVDPAFFRTERSRSNIVDVDSDDIALKRTALDGVKVRKAMDKALSEIESAQKGSVPKLNPKDKKWTGIYKETQAKMGSADEPSESDPFVARRAPLLIHLGSKKFIVILRRTTVSTISCEYSTSARSGDLVRGSVVSSVGIERKRGV